MFSFRNTKSLLLFVLILAVFCCSAVLSKRTQSSQANSLPQMVDDPFMSEIKKITDSYRRCLLDQVFYANETWKRIPSAIEACAVGKFWRSLDVHKVKIPALNVHYHFIPPKPIDSPCVAVRMNILGNSGLIPEKTLRQMMPQCEFFGAGNEDVVNFHTIGKFYRKFSSFTEPPDHVFDDGTGIHVSYAQVPLYPILVKVKTFLEKYVKRPRIDYLWISSPGDAPVVNAADGNPAAVPHAFFHELSILRDPINITVCQVTVPAVIFAIWDGVDLTMNTRPRFKPLFISILSKSSLLPIRGEYISIKLNPGVFEYLNLFFINISDPYCAKKYLSMCDSTECQDDEFYEN